jgi:hypothetical protein
LFQTASGRRLPARLRVLAAAALAVTVHAALSKEA